MNAAGQRRRVRRQPDEARRLILEAAEKRLVEGGPEAVRVQLVAGDLGLTDAAVHHHFGEDLVYSSRVGMTHWERGKSEAGLPGAEPAFFFAPTVVAERVRDWGAEGFQERLGAAFDDFRGLFIPVGVAHGFSAKTDIILSYLVDDYYDTTDEHGVAWDDPGIGIDWDVDITVKSERDTKNPRLKEIPVNQLPA